MINSSRKNKEGGPQGGDVQLGWGENKLALT